MMKNLLKLTQIAGIGLMSVGLVNAQTFLDLETNAVSENLSSYLKSADDGWFAYSIPAAAGTHSMCCYNQGEKAACDLTKKQYGFGSSSDSPYTDNIHVFVHLDNGGIKRVMPIGDHCHVKAKGLTVDWLTDVSNKESINWLKHEASQTAHDSNNSLYVLSLHQSDAAPEALVDLAADNAGEYSEQAVFWLGQRQSDGYEYLAELYDSLPVGEVRRKLNFALSQNKTKDSVALLKGIALEDRDSEQQADAIFWLSQTDGVTDLPEFLIKLMSTTESDEVQEKAIFSLSQIQTSEANQELAKLVKDHKDAEVREKSLFWLAQNSPERARVAAMDLLKTSSRESEQENAVFVLSQLPGEQSSAALFSVIKGDYNRNIKKKALFWLSQSDNEDTISQLEKLL
jgi:HEAT repeat protein